jgi:hypothetical protein
VKLDEMLEVGWGGDVEEESFEFIFFGLDLVLTNGLDEALVIF